MRGKFLRKCLPYIFLAPTFITLVIFLYLSVGVAFGISLTDKMASPAFETHFIGLHEDLYGKQINVRFYRRLRGIVRFDTLDELKAQIARDVEQALSIGLPR